MIGISKTLTKRDVRFRYAHLPDGISLSKLIGRGGLLILRRHILYDDEVLEGFLPPNNN